MRHKLLKIAFTASLLSSLCLLYGQQPATEQLLAQADSLMALGKHEKARHLAQDAVFLSKKTKDWEELITAYNILFQCTDIQTIQAKNYLDSAQFFAKAQLSPSNSYAYNVLLNNQGIFEYQKGNLPKAIYYLKQVSKNEDFLKNGREKFLAKVYNNIGLLHRKIGDFAAATPYYHQAQGIYADFLTKASNSSDSLSAHQLLATNHNNIAQVHNYLEEYPKAYQALQKTLKIHALYLPQYPEIQISYGRYCINMAAHFKERKMADSSHYYLDRSRKYIGKNTTQLQRYHKFKGVVFRQQLDYQKALRHLTLSLELLKEYSKDKHAAIAGTHWAIGQVHQDQKNWKSSLYEYQKALSFYVENFKDSTDLSKNPDLADIHLQPDALEVLIGKANLFVQVGDLDNALSTYALTIDLILKMRQDFQAKDSKFFLSEKYEDIYEIAIGLAFTLYNDNQTIKYAQLALRISEQNKAALLLEAANDAEALGKAQVPDSLTQAIQCLKSDIAYYEKLLTNKHTSGGRKTLEKQGFERRQALNKRMEFIEKKYPRYFQLKYKPTIRPLQDIQQFISLNDRVLLEYFYGQNALYCFYLHKDRLEFLKIDKTPQFEQDLHDFIALFQDPNKTTGEYGLERYTKLAFKLYQNLVEPARISHGQSLLIIPDGPLAKLPFSVLISSTQPQPFHRLPYLLHAHTISYAFSASLMATHSKKSKQKHRILALAPFAHEEGLRHSQAEVLAIKKLAYTKTLFNQAATKQSFLDLANKFQIVHLSTHAHAENPEPHIQFHDKTLTLSELYSLNLKPKLAILSACETSLGEDQQGEGIQSLANGFAYAGIPSLVSSLWAVNDRATSDIMGFFYKELSKGSMKPEALQTGQKNYLKSVKRDALASPYYWAGFVLVGDIESVDLEGVAGFSWWLLVAVAFAAALPWYVRGRFFNTRSLLLIRNKP